jgi:hypothetical protein
MYKNIKAQPTPAKELILEVERLTGRKESAIRKWLDGSTRPDDEIRIKLEEAMGMSLDILTIEYYNRLNQPTNAQTFRKRIGKVACKSPSTVLRYVLGSTMPDALTQAVIAKEFNTSISTLFP